MPLMTVLLILWAVLTTILVILIMYRSTLTMHEDDQLFLSDTASHMEVEQKELLRKVHRITPIVSVLGATSGLLILVIAGMWVWRGLNNIQ
jgi:hypothetical protein